MRFAFVGDVMLGRLVNEELMFAPPEYPWGNTLNTLLSANARFCNLECVLSDKGQPWSRTTKAFHFRTDAENIAVLKKASIDAVSLANNHILDYEEEALIDTIENLDSNNIKSAGAGRNIVEASSPAVFPVDRKAVALIAFTDNELLWEAGENKPGIFYVPIDSGSNQAKRLFDAMEEIREDVDTLIVSAHWGGNWGYDVPPEHIDFAHDLIEHGADIIFGHSPHVFRGIEIYKDRPILYSCGDFIDDYAVDEIQRNDESFIFMVEIINNAITKILLYPAVIEHFQANLAANERAEIVSATMQSLCHHLNTHPIWHEEGFLEIDMSKKKKVL